MLALPSLDASGAQAIAQNFFPADWQLRRLQCVVPGARAAEREVLSEKQIDYWNDLLHLL